MYIFDGDRRSYLQGNNWTSGLTMDDSETRHCCSSEKCRVSKRGKKTGTLKSCRSSKNMQQRFLLPHLSLFFQEGRKLNYASMTGIPMIAR